MADGDTERKTAAPLARHQFDAGRLIEEHPPRWHHPNKVVVFDVARSCGHPFEGSVRYARWPTATLPRIVRSRSQFQVRPGHFTYGADRGPGTVNWHMNFADPHLFVAYGSPLLAQDELQVAEHPILGSLREALIGLGDPARTEDPSGAPTPVTVAGVQRRCAIDTLPNPAAGRPHGLYGNAFARASAGEVRAASRAISPPTISNILAMAAPAGGNGLYAREELDSIVATAYTGFLAARCETAGLAAAPSRTLIHTGFWGCGAFGGNRTVMTLLQSLAADLADVDLAFYAFDNAGIALAEEARALYARTRDASPEVGQMLETLVRQRFEWGESDGN